jgi:CNT family concentrative nucleoside transporter
MMFFAWCLSTNRKVVNWRAVIGGLIMQILFAIFILRTEWGRSLFEAARESINAILELSDKGSSFLFGDSPATRTFGFRVLPTVIFISSLCSLLFYWGIIPRMIRVLSYVMKHGMNVSAVEGLLTGTNIFVGQAESALFIRPYLKTMTLSEINTMMTVGMAMTSGSVLSAYVSFGISAGHLITASVMSAPAAILISKLLLPETEDLKKRDKNTKLHHEKASNLFEAACNGASEGLKLALSIGAMLIAFISLIALVNLLFAKLGAMVGLTLSFESLVGYIFQPFAFLLGIEWKDTAIIGRLLGEKTVLNEFIAYIHLGEHVKAGELSPRSVTIATYALCGFANFGSVAMQIGGIGALEPSRRGDLARCGIRALIGGTLASFMSACIAGILI